MSSGTHVAVLAAGGRQRSRLGLAAPAVRERPLLRFGAFSALAIYGVLRWATLLQPTPGWRLFGLLSVSILIAASPWALRARGWIVLVPFGLLGALAVLALSGVPMTWLTHLRIAVTARAIHEGLSSLPAVLLPYLGINQWTRMVIVMGAGGLLVLAGLLMASAPRHPSDVRRGLVALPLVALAVVPSTLIRPQLPYLQGFVLFALLVAFLWGEQVASRHLGAAGSMVCMAGVAGMLAGPLLDQHKPWVNYQGLAGAFAPGNLETFDWSQRYGPLRWPRTGSAVLEVKAGRPDYWKAENLDLFDGRGWMQGEVSPGQPQPQPQPAEVARWTQTVQFTLRGMRTADVIGSGESSAPMDLSGSVARGLSPGTWMAGADLVPGDSYRITTYSPHPSGAELAATGSTYSGAGLDGYRAMLLPQTPVAPVSPEIVFAPFHSRQPPSTTMPIIGADAVALLRASPYARAYALAGRLAGRARTAYAFVEGVERYLAHGFSYDENPPGRAFPLVSFLFTDRRGYCQQFAGSMALLLRMGGIPARVAAGFTTGTYDDATHSWIVSDQDAHAWVEAWFPKYGWVRFDPTPAAAPARGGRLRLSSLSSGRSAATKPRTTRHELPEPAPATTSPKPAGSSLGPVLILLIVLGLVLAGLAMRLVRGKPEPSSDELLAELKRALARTGRPIGAGVTLSELERRFRTSPQAEAYVRAIRLSRYAGTGERPTAAQRRALRSQLRAGLGLPGLVRSFWALPPSWGARSSR